MLSVAASRAQFTADRFSPGSCRGEDEAGREGPAHCLFRMSPSAVPMHDTLAHVEHPVARWDTTKDTQLVTLLRRRPPRPCPPTPPP